MTPSGLSLTRQPPDTDAAKSSALELREFLQAHGEQVDAASAESEYAYEDPTKAGLALAAKHGFEWTGYLGWGDEGLTGCPTST